MGLARGRAVIYRPARRDNLHSSHPRASFGPNLSLVPRDLSPFLSVIDRVDARHRSLSKSHPSAHHLRTANHLSPLSPTARFSLLLLSLSLSALRPGIGRRRYGKERRGKNAAKNRVRRVMTGDSRLRVPLNWYISFRQFRRPGFFILSFFSRISPLKRFAPLYIWNKRGS